MAELVENFLRVDFHQVDVFDEKPEMLVKGRGVNRIDHRHKGAPVLVKKLERFFFELAFAQFVHETGLIDGFLPAPVAFRRKIGDEFFGLRLVEF